MEELSKLIDISITETNRQNKITKKSFLKNIKDRILKKSIVNVHPEYQDNIITDKKKEDNEIGLNRKLDTINERLDTFIKPDMKKGLKGFKLPRKIQRKLKKLAIRNKVLVILLGTNKTVKPIITDMIDGFISINGVPHNCSLDFIFLWKGRYPCIVLPEWDLNPIGTNDYYKAVEDKRTAHPIAIVMRMIKAGEKLIDAKNKMPNAYWIWAGLGVIVVLYVLFKPG